MRIDKVRVKLAATHSLADYCNVRPEVELEVSLADGEEAGAVVADLRMLMRQWIFDEIREWLVAYSQPAGG